MELLWKWSSSLNGRAYCAARDLCIIERVEEADWPACGLTLLVTNTADIKTRVSEWEITHNETNVLANNVNSLGRKHRKTIIDGLKTNPFSNSTTRFLSSPESLFYQMHLFTFCLPLFFSPSQYVLSTVTNISEKHGARMICHYAGNHESLHSLTS
jgi:hypothetical protein